MSAEPDEAMRRVRGVEAIAMDNGRTARRDDLAVFDAELSFEDFYRDNRLQVARALALTLGDRELAAEATDEAMVRAYQRWSRVGGLDNPGGWVYRVGLNWSRSILRRAARGQRPPAERHADEPMIPEPTVVAALGALSVDHRAVVVCRFLLGWSEEQTAEALGIRRGTAKSRTARALAQLRTDLHHLAPEGDR